MPLQDSFGKKTTKGQDSPKPSRGRHFNQLPTIDALRESLMSAQDTPRQPVVITWKAGAKSPVFMLTCLRNTEEVEPMWMLHVDEKNALTSLWSYNSSDPELIHNLISEQVLEKGPAAVIPDSLRRKPAAEQQEEGGQAQFFLNYEILETIGRGGMGIIYKAKDRTDGEFVALKVLRADLMVEKSNVERFKNEASAVRSLQHPNLIALREFGVSRFGQPFLAMDYLEGVELQTVLHQQDHLDMPNFINIFTQICEALAYAHEQGLVHRDIKPGNVMLVKNPSGKDIVKIIDFGIAKSVQEQPTKTSSITTFGRFLGSPAYMSPEQCGGAVLDSRSDIYSLGCVMYEAVTGRLPFNFDNVLKVILAHVNDTPPAFHVVRPDIEVPATLEQIIMKALRKNPNERYQTARDLCEDLWEFAALDSRAPLVQPPPAALLSANVSMETPTFDQVSHNAAGGQVMSGTHHPVFNPNEQPADLGYVQSGTRFPVFNPNEPQPSYDSVQSGRHPAFNPNEPQPNYDSVQSGRHPAFNPNEPQPNYDSVQSGRHPAFNPNEPASDVGYVQSGANIPVFRPSAQQVDPNQVQSAPNIGSTQPPQGALRATVPMSGQHPVPPTAPMSGQHPVPPTAPMSGQHPVPPPPPPPPPPAVPSEAPAAATGSRAPQQLMRMSHLETNVLSDLAYTLLRRSEVLNDDLLQVLMDCIETLENGEITLEQAIAVIRHATNKYKSGDTG